MQTTENAPVTGDHTPDSDHNQEEERRGRGRPRKDDPQLGFFAKLRNYTPEQWERLVVYLYMLSPILDRTQGGKEKKYVSKYNAPFDEDTVKHEFGSGSYRALLNETNPNGREQKTIDRYEFDIFDMKHPPKIPEGSWMDDPRNERWAWARKKEDTPQAQQQAAATDPNTIFKTVFEAVRQLRPETPKDDSASITKSVIEAMKMGNQQAWEMFKSQAQNNDPTSMLKMVEAILAVVKPEKATSDPMITLLMQELKSSRDAAAAAAKQSTDILLAMLTKQSETSGKSPMESIKEMAEGFAVIKEAFGGDSSPTKTGVLDIIKEVLSPLAGAFAPVLGALAMGAMNKSRAPQPQGPPPQYQPQAGQPQLQAAPPQQQTNGAPQPEVIDPQLQGFIGLSQQVAQAISMGLAGDVFAEAFERQHGAAMYDQIVSTPLDGLLQAMQSVPQVWGILQPFEAKLPIFIAQFYDYAKDEPEIEEEPQAQVQEAVPPSKKPPGRKKGAAIQ